MIRQTETSLDVNSNSLEIVNEMIKNSRKLGLAVTRLANGTTVVDAGIKAHGGLRAGLLVAKASLGGLAEVTLSAVSYSNDTVLPRVNVVADFPAISLLVCQQPFPTIEVGSYTAIVSGPGKVLVGKPEEYFKITGYSEKSKVAVFVMQGKDLPDEKVSDHLAEECRIKTRDLFLIALPTNCVANAVQVAARVIENPIWRLSYLGFDVNRIACALGSAPLSPTYSGMWKAPGITPDDMILYMGKVIFYAEPKKGDDLRSLVKELVTANSPLRGKSFHQILTEAGGEFKRIDRRKYTVAQAAIFDTVHGKIYRAGSSHLDMIKKLTAKEDT